MAATASSDPVGLPSLPEPRALPGATVPIEVHEAMIADHVLGSPPSAHGPAHPLWLLLLAMRGMGVTVDELCELAGKRDQDLLLFGNCRSATSGDGPVVGGTYRVDAAIAGAERKVSRSGAVLDFVVVDADIHDVGSGEQVGTVANTFIFKRAVA